ncbi:putative quinone oxidoreductase [Halenospora varia]|nr:putative quinone oxidoreductase [Halenospora varia]
MNKARRVSHFTAKPIQQLTSQQPTHSILINTRINSSITQHRSITSWRSYKSTTKSPFKMSLPTTMKAINNTHTATYTYSNKPVLEDLTFNASQPFPSPAPNQVLIKVHAVGITPYELTWPIEPVLKPRVPCHDLAGTVVSAPADSGFVTGDRVFGLIDYQGQGGMAEYTLAEPEYLAKVPEGMTFVEAASLPRATLTPYQAMKVQKGGFLKVGDRVLITGATGAVGRMAIQMIRAWIGPKGYIIAVGGSGTEHLKALGADRVVNYRESREWGLELKEGVTVDVVFDVAGGSSTEKTLLVIRDGGKIVTIGSPPPEYRSVEGWSDNEKRGIDAFFFIVSGSGEQLTEVGKMFTAGQIKPSVSVEVNGLDLEGIRTAWGTALKGGIGGTVVVKVC